MEATRKIEGFCEFHVHLEGCVWPEHIRNWWTKSEFLFPPPSHNRDVRTPFEMFLEHLRFGYNFLNTPEAYAEVAYLYARRCAMQNIRYAELQLNSALLRTWDMPLVAVLENIAARVASVENGPLLRYVVDLPWQFDARYLLSIIDEAHDIYALGVRAISMGGDERLARPEEIAEVLPDVRRAGFMVQCHVGETTVTDKALRLIECINPDRITHGVLIADWIEERGAASPPIDVCLSSNVTLQVVRSIKEHPLRRWWKANVPICLSTDDPAIFETTLEAEYALAATICPEMSSEREKIVAHWLNAALDPEALAQQLNLSVAKKEPPQFMPLKDAEGQFEKNLIVAALCESGGNISEAARHLNVHRKNLQQKIRLLGIDPASTSPER